MVINLTSFQPTFNARVEETQKFAIFVRASELQESAVLDLKDLGGEIRTLKHSAIGRGDEDEANGFLALELIAHGLESELQCYLSLKSDDPGGRYCQKLCTGSRRTLSS
jgi:hypothetical protein